MSDISTCTVCGDSLTDENWYPSDKSRNSHRCKRCNLLKTAKWRNDNPEKYRSGAKIALLKRGHLPMKDNRQCSSFLGVHVAERVLSKIFKDVVRMPYGHSGYDIVCNRGKLVDSKASCKRYQQGRYPLWQFNIKKNKIADFFLLLAFDNRESLSPLHLWMIPGAIINDRDSVSISVKNVHKWDAYALPIDKVVSCCNTMRGESK